MNEEKEKFTPGPWVVLEQRELFNEDYDFSVECSDGYVCRVENCNLEEEEANAHLIAAAQEMYRLLSLLEDVCRDNNLNVWTNAIVNVLNKARGEE